MSFGATEIIIIFFIILLLFGGKRIPGMAKGIAESIRNFRNGLNDGQKSEDPTKK